MSRKMKCGAVAVAVVVVVIEKFSCSLYRTMDNSRAATVKSGWICGLYHLLRAVLVYMDTNILININIYMSIDR